MKTLVVLLAALGLASYAAVAPTPAIESELVFPLEHWHNHARGSSRRPTAIRKAIKHARFDEAWSRARPQ